MADERVLRFPDSRTMNSYVAAAIADCMRRLLVARKKSFTFETVMSSRDKIALLEDARRIGFRTYLYFVATEDPIINVSRVNARVKSGGHSVPEGKIVERYHRSLCLLPEAIRHANRAYLFDNSGDTQTHSWIAEITEGRELTLKTDLAPAWFARAMNLPL